MNQIRLPLNHREFLMLLAVLAAEIARRGVRSAHISADEWDALRSVKARLTMEAVRAGWIQAADEKGARA